jgi:hypothetical protein
MTIIRFGIACLLIGIVAWLPFEAPMECSPRGNGSK